MTQMRNALLAVTTLVAMNLCGSNSVAAKIESLNNLPQAIVTINSKSKSYSYLAWLATTPERQEQGLMFVTSLKPNNGMLFIFDEAETRAFWMKNTLIPLDLLFVAANGRIIRIVPNAQPQSESLISSIGPASQVLELAGGECSKHDIREGDYVTHEVVPPQTRKSH